MDTTLPCRDTLLLFMDSPLVGVAIVMTATPVSVVNGRGALTLVAVSEAKLGCRPQATSSICST
eukprot:2423771-Rhodomonas_salina.2